eukprot:Pgem_evm1s8775
MQGKQKYQKFVVQDMRTFAEVLAYFQTLDPPVDHFLEMLPRLQCRYYSISSSPELHFKSIHLTAVVV